jgi:hypothetical protein
MSLIAQMTDSSLATEGMIPSGASCDLTCDVGYTLSDQPTCTAGTLSSNTPICEADCDISGIIQPTDGQFGVECNNVSCQNLAKNRGPIPTKVKFTLCDRYSTLMHRTNKASISRQ